MLQKSGSRCIGVSRDKACLVSTNNRRDALPVCILLTMLLTAGSDINAQVAGVDVWNVPWTVIGDSTMAHDRDGKFVVTGKIVNSDTKCTVSGALVCADFLKHYDYSDEDGSYVLELPRGNYRIKVK